MATRRKKASTRVRARKGARAVKSNRAKARPKKTLAKSQAKKTVTPVAPKGKSTGRKGPSQGKGKTKAKVSAKGAQKPAGKAKGSASKGKRAPRGKPKRAVRSTPEKAFRALLKKSARKLTSPRYTRRAGRSFLRGVDKTSRERAIVVNAFWEDVREGWLEASVMRALESMFTRFQRPPTLYTRFTFAVSNVRELLTGGSPKLVRATKKKLTQWFQSSGLSFTLDGARYQFHKALDDIAESVKQALSDSADAKFFLRFVTVIAYVVES
jgi:hypothetical protein